MYPEHTIGEVMEMEKNSQEKLSQKNKNEMSHGMSEKGKPENQNQTHNSRREGMGPNTKRRSD
jgi:hypothetical protein